MPILSSKLLQIVTSSSNPNRCIFKTRHFLSNQVTLDHVLSSASVTWFLAYPQHNDGSNPAPCPFLIASPEQVKVVILLWSTKIVLTWNAKSGSVLKMESECKYHIRNSEKLASLQGRNPTTSKCWSYSGFQPYCPWQFCPLQIAIPSDWNAFNGQKSPGRTK